MVRRHRRCWGSQLAVHGAVSVVWCLSLWLGHSLLLLLLLLLMLVLMLMLLLPLLCLLLLLLWTLSSSHGANAEWWRQIINCEASLQGIVSQRATLLGQLQQDASPGLAQQLTYNQRVLFIWGTGRGKRRSQQRIQHKHTMSLLWSLTLPTHTQLVPCAHQWMTVLVSVSVPH